MKETSENVREIAAKSKSVENRLYGSKFVVLEIGLNSIVLVDRETDTALIVTAAGKEGLNIDIVVVA